MKARNLYRHHLKLLQQAKQWIEEDSRSSAGSPLKETETAASIGRSALDYPDPAHFLTGLKRKRLAIGTFQIIITIIRTIQMSIAHRKVGNRHSIRGGYIDSLLERKDI